MSKDAKLNWVRLPVDSIENCRELGGYDTRYGQQTRWHSFVRSSDMSKLTREDASFLEAYGVKTVIDLRGPDEIATHQNPLADESFCRYHNVPLITGQITDIARWTTANVFVGDFYVELLESNDAVVKIFNIIADAEEGCIVFHCQGGKDRTGILAMLLLGLVEVDRRDIVSNYEVTYTYLETLHQYESPRYGNIPKEFLYSDRTYILRAYEHILHTYQSVERYLLAKGVEAEAVARVKRRLVGS